MARPDGVEGVGVEGQQPTCGDLLFANPVQTDRRPAALDASDDGSAVGHDGDIVAIADQHVPRVQTKRPLSKLSSPCEVSKDGVDAPVVAGNGIVSGHVLSDVFGQQGSDGVRVAADIESALGGVEPAQDLHRRLSIHATHLDANR